MENRVIHAVSEWALIDFEPIIVVVELAISLVIHGFGANVIMQIYYINNVIFVYTDEQYIL